MDEKKVLDENEKEVAPLPLQESRRKIRINKIVKMTTIENKKMAEKNRINKRRAKNKRARLSKKKNRK